MNIIHLATVYEKHYNLYFLLVKGSFSWFFSSFLILFCASVKSFLGVVCCSTLIQF